MHIYAHTMAGYVGLGLTTFAFIALVITYFVLAFRSTRKA